MKLNLIILFFWFSVDLFGLTDSLAFKQLREKYYKAVEDEEYIDSARAFIKFEFSEHEVSNSPLLKAYSAAIVAVEAKHAFWPHSKLGYLNDSMEDFEPIIKHNPESLEIRFLRFSILHHVPGILGYGDELNEDLHKIVDLFEARNFGSIDPGLLDGIFSFLVESERLSEAQLKRLQSSQFLHENNLQIGNK